MKRGNIVIVAQRGLFEGKPRPAVVIQLDELVGSHPTILTCPISADPRANTGAFYRVPVEPNEGNGLRRSSILMVDRIATIIRGNLGETIGSLDVGDLSAMDRALALVQGLT